MASPFRRSMTSLHPARRRSRSPSPVPNDVRAPELLTQCIQVLSSIILEDCRYRIGSPRPSRPSYALQAVTLEIYRFLLHIHRNNSKVVSQLGFALIPAFYTFPQEMHARLLQFFEQCILRGDLEDLRRIQGPKEAMSG